MLEIKTKFGNFGSARDLYLYMRDENIDVVNIDTRYIFDTVAKMKMTINEVKEWAELNK